MGHGWLDFLKGTPGGARWVWVRSLSWRCQVSVSEVIILVVPGECEGGHYPESARWVWGRSLFWRCQVSEWGQYPGGARWVGGHYSWRCLVSVSEAPGGDCECERGHYSWRCQVSVSEVITPGGARWVWVRSLLLEVPGECEWGPYSWRCQVSVSEVLTPGGARWVRVRLSTLVWLTSTITMKCIQRQSSSVGIQNCNPSSTSSLLLLEFIIVTPVLHPKSLLLLEFSIVTLGLCPKTVFFCLNSTL